MVELTKKHPIIDYDTPLRKWGHKMNWLVVSTPLKNISQWEGLSHRLWKIKNVWNHQPVNRSTTKSGFVGGCLWTVGRECEDATNKNGEEDQRYTGSMYKPQTWNSKLHIIWSNDSDNILRLSQAQIQQPAGIAQQQNSNVQWVCEKSRTGDSPGDVFSTTGILRQSPIRALKKGHLLASRHPKHPHEGNQSCHEFLCPSCQSFSATAVAHQTHQQEEFLRDLGLNMRNIRGEHFNQCHTTCSMGKI